MPGRATGSPAWGSSGSSITIPTSSPADVFGVCIRIANSVPRVVLGSIFIIAFGLGMASKVAVLALVADYALNGIEARFVG